MSNSVGSHGGAIRSSSSLTVTNSEIKNNTSATRGGAFDIGSGNRAVTTAHNNCIVGNSATSVYKYLTPNQDFTGNWWGAADGPSGKGPGSGDSVGDRIIYTDFLSTDICTPSLLGSLTLSPLAAGPNVTGTNQTLTALLLDHDGNPLADVTVGFVISGPNAASYSAPTGIDGTASVIYSGNVSGIDEVQATVSDHTVTLTSNVVQVMWVVPVEQISTTTVWGRFFMADSSGVFKVTPDTEPVFSQAFPTINFNPAPNTVPGCPADCPNPYLTTFTTVTTDINGTYTGRIKAEGNGYHPGENGDMFSFAVVFTGEFIVAEAGDINFWFYSDDGFLFGIGNGASRVSGEFQGTIPNPAVTVFENYPILGANNTSHAPVGDSVTVHFPAPGTYPYEIDFTQGPATQRAFTMTLELDPTTRKGIPSAGTLTIQPGTPQTRSAMTEQTFTVTAIDAGGTPQGNIPVTLVVVGANAQELYAFTDITGEASFAYTGYNAGKDVVQATAWSQGDKPAVSAKVEVNWTGSSGSQPPGVPLATPGCIGSPDNQDAIFGQVPVTVSSELANPQTVTLDYWPYHDITAITTLVTDHVVAPGGMIATLDTTLLANDSYVIHAYCVDQVTNEERNSGVLVTVVGENKPGRVRFSVTDLVVPVTGLPITIGRTYDSLERHHSGDFGYGWSLDIASPRVEVDQAHNVTLTMPDGKRSTFFFTPYAPSPWFGFLLVPAYTPEPGIYGSLTANGCGLLTIAGGSPFCFPGGQYETSAYTYTDPYGRVFEIDGDDGLKSIRDLNNNTLTFSPDGLQSSSGGLQVSFVRDAAGRITQITDPENNVYHYGYDAQGDLVSVQLPELPANPVTYTYYSGPLAHFFWSGTDPRGNTVATTTYTPEGRLHSLAQPVGNETYVTTYEYDVPNNTTSVTYPNGGTEVSVTNDAGYVISLTDPLGRITSYEYDDNYNILSQTNALNETTRYTYDDQGNLTTITDAQNIKVVEAQYNQYGGPTSLTNALLETLTITYDPNTYMPLHADDAIGRLGGYSWDDRGNPLTQSDGVGASVEYEYDAYGNVVKLTDPMERAQRYSYNTLGYQLQSIAPNGTTTSYTYDALGRLRSASVPLDGTTTYSTHYDYDANGNRIAMVDAEGRRTEYVYDPLNRLVEVKYFDPENPTAAPLTYTYSYDFRGNVLTETDPTGVVTRYEYDLAGQLIQKTVGSGTPHALITRYAYDDAGRLTLVTVAPGTSAESKTRYIYNAAGYLTDFISGWQTVDQSTTHYEYNAAGQVVAVTEAYNSPDAVNTTYDYDARGRLTDIFYQWGRVQREYDGAGRITRLVDETDLPTIYSYNLSGQPIDVIKAPGPNQLRTHYEYSNPLGQLSAVTTAYGTIHAATTNYAYDALGRLVQQNDPFGHPTHYTYDAVNQLLQVTDANQATTRYVYDHMGRRKSTIYPDDSFAEQSYDAAGRTVSQRVPNGVVTEYAYNPAGQLVTTTLAPNTTEASATSYAYDPAWQLSSVIRGYGSSLPSKTAYSYDALGRNTEVTIGAGTVDASTTAYSYNALSQITSVVDDNGHATTYLYNSRGLVTDITYPDATQIHNAYDSAGRLLNTYDEANHLTGYAYDPVTKLLSSVSAAWGTAAQSTTSYGYDAAWRQTSVTTATGSALAESTTTYQYDLAGRLTHATRASGTPDAATTAYAYDPVGQLTAITDAKSHITGYEYDAVGRLRFTTFCGAVCEAGDPKIEQVYNSGGQLTARIDQEGHRTAYSYDPAGRLASVTLAADSMMNAATTAYDYDTLGNLVSVTDANQHTTSYVYDALGRQTRKNWPDGVSYETFAYDGVGNLTAHRLADGAVNTFTYDLRDRLDTVNYTASGVPLSVDYSYTANGLLNQVVDYRGTTTYGYDAQNRVTSIAQPGGAVAYTYDLAGNRRSMTVTDGLNNAQTLEYGYDAHYNLTSLTAQGQTTTLAYDALDLLTTVNYPNGIAESRQYDPLNRLTLLTQTQTATSTLVGSYSYTYDDAGNRTGVTELDGTTLAWTYDDAYRLIQEIRTPAGSPATTTSYTYDPVGNRLTETVNGQQTAYSYNSLDQLTSMTPPGGPATSYSYDGRGNLAATSDGTQYAYDSLDRLTTVTLPGSTIAYGYDADGRRVSQTANGQVTNYLWDPLSPYGDVVLETDATGATTARYALAGTRLMAQTRGGTTSTYLPDGQGSTRALADAIGTITDTYAYTAYGDFYAQTGTTVNPYLYTGQRLDALTGLYNLRARDYAPTLGRFLTRDSFPLNQYDPREWNRYAYAAGNPVTFGDPTGYNLTDYGITVATIGGATIGFLVGAGSDLAFRLVLNGGSIEDNLKNGGWKSVLVSGLLGAMSGGVGGYLGAKSAIIGAMPKGAYIALAADALIDVGLGTLADITFFGKDLDVALATNTLSFGLASGLGYAFGKVIGSLHVRTKTASNDLPGGGPHRPHDPPNVPDSPTTPHRGGGGDPEPPYRDWGEPDGLSNPGRDPDPGGRGGGGVGDDVAPPAGQLSNDMPNPAGWMGGRDGVPDEVLREAVGERAVAISTQGSPDYLSNSQRGPVLTGVRDNTTGEIFFGLNEEASPPNLHPILQERLTNYLAETGGETPVKAGVPGAHSEIYALNEALRAFETRTGRAATEADLSNFSYHNRTLLGPNRAKIVPPACPNCERLIQGVRVVP